MAEGEDYVWLSLLMDWQFKENFKGGLKAEMLSLHMPEGRTEALNNSG